MAIVPDRRFAGFEDRSVVRRRLRHNTAPDAQCVEEPDHPVSRFPRLAEPAPFRGATLA